MFLPEQNPRGKVPSENPRSRESANGMTWAQGSVASVRGHPADKREAGFGLQQPGSGTATPNSTAVLGLLWTVLPKTAATSLTWPWSARNRANATEEPTEKVYLTLLKLKQPREGGGRFISRQLQDLQA